LHQHGKYTTGELNTNINTYDERNELMVILFCFISDVDSTETADIKNMNESSPVRFEVLTAASMKMTVFWVVAQCSLVDVYRRFRGAC
jgi:hypothetical protein